MRTPRIVALALSLAVAAPLVVSLAPSALAQPRRPGPKGPKGPPDKGPDGPPDQPKPDEPKKDEKAISLSVGENKTILAPDVKQYSEGPGGIAEIKLTPDGKKFIIVGVKQGTTSLLLIRNDGTQTNYVINVFSQAPEQIESELGQLLDGYPGLRVRRIGARLFIEGGVGTAPEAEKIKQIAELYTGQVESLVTVGMGSIDRKINIRVDFFFVQYDKSSGYQVGITYPRSVGGEFITSNFGYDFISGVRTANFVVANQALPALDIAAANGWAKVIKQSTIITTNGNEATFENGGEENFAVSSGFAASIEKLRFGTNVTVLPRFDPQTRNIEVRVKSDVSDLTPSARSTLPGRQTAKLDTLVFLHIGQTLILSGIRTQSQRHQIQGLPLLSQIPILGVFFGSHLDQEDQIEGAVFIVPTVVDSAPKGDLVKDAMQTYRDYSGDIESVNTYPKTPPAETK